LQLKKHGEVCITKEKIKIKYKWPKTSNESK